MRALAKKILFPFLRPLATFYLSKTRRWSYRGLRFNVSPGVFHPGLFLSSKVLMNYLASLNLKGQKMLEVGCGSGAISIFAAQQGALVTAVDLNPAAVKNAKQNANLNQVQLDVRLSNLFENLETQQFKKIVVNPPYYPKSAKNAEELAWYCGADFEFFRGLFSGTKDHLLPKGQMLMILSEDCDLNKIWALADESSLNVKEVFRKKVWAEWNYIFEITAG